MPTFLSPSMGVRLPGCSFSTVAKPLASLARLKKAEAETSLETSLGKLGWILLKTKSNQVTSIQKGLTTTSCNLMQAVSV